MDLDAVKTSYARWAPVCDATFGRITDVGQREAVRHNNACGGDVLEVGLGTGLPLEAYRDEVHVTGVDDSPDMLRKAEARVAKRGLHNVAELGVDSGRGQDDTLSVFPVPLDDVGDGVFGDAKVPRDPSV